MAVVGFATEFPGIRGANLQNNRRQRFRSFKVICDSVYDGPDTALAAPGLPLPYTSYETNTETDENCVVVDRQADQDKKLPTLFRVDVTYDTQYERLDDNPFADPVKLDFSFETFQEPLAGVPVTTYLGTQANSQVSSASSDPNANQILKWGAGVTNSAGEPFNPPAERESSRPIVTFTRNEPAFSLATAVKFVNSVNASAWSGLEPRQAMCKGISASFQYRKFNTVGKPDIGYFETKYIFAIKRETWDLALLNIGTYSLTTAATFDDMGRLTNNPPVAKVPSMLAGRPTPVLLKADGTKLAAGAVPTFRIFRVAPEREFSELNILLNLSIDKLKPKK
jgi:hypothetical protein